ncbi:Tabersonine 16-O-methyltransferase [Morus notabilis]|uniref:Tabersonine 16-O-methyltransferase n=1 Tax=Morus notabilis TaxID=981085 RepID=W9S789_9ROSA|nr:Tabersonine 16-O-methyltransferase [Morus notabilis]
MLSFISSMSIKSAVQLSIPDIINNDGQPITLSELASALDIHPTKAGFIHRLMCLLVHHGFFNSAKIGHDEEAYDLTPSSRLLKDKIPSLSPFVMSLLDPALITPWHLLGNWFQKEEKMPPFESAHGMSFWAYVNKNSDFNNHFNQAMAIDSGMMNLVVKDCKPVFEGLSSLVDVGGGTGTISKIIIETFPHIKCTVLDLPHVVANLPATENLKFIGGDMFQGIPSADAILLKLMLHCWSDEECLKVLKICRVAIPSNGGKVIITDIVINKDKDDPELTEGKLYFDLLMMILVTGRERSEKDWEKLFLEAGFSHYKITPLFGLRSLIEVFPRKQLSSNESVHLRTSLISMVARNSMQLFVFLPYVYELLK